MVKTRVTEIGSPTNGARKQIEMTQPYIVEVTIKGVSDFLFHRWNNEAIAEKSAAKKGSAAKKSDDLESYVYRDDKGYLCIPGEYVRMSVIGSARFKQDPRSPRKSAADLYKAAIISLTNLASVGQKEWDYEDRRRVLIQRNGVTRTRPALKAGWKITVQIQVNLAEYVSPEDLNEVISSAGRLVGIGDFRPTFGRFQIESFKVLDL